MAKSPRDIAIIILTIISLGIAAFSFAVSWKVFQGGIVEGGTEKVPGRNVTIDKKHFVPSNPTDYKRKSDHKKTG